MRALGKLFVRCATGISRAIGPWERVVASLDFHKQELNELLNLSHCPRDISSGANYFMLGWSPLKLNFDDVPLFPHYRYFRSHVTVGSDGDVSILNFIH